MLPRKKKKKKNDEMNGKKSRWQLPVPEKIKKTQGDVSRTGDGSRNTFSIIPLDENGRENWSR